MALLKDRYEKLFCNALYDTLNCKKLLNQAVKDFSCDSPSNRYSGKQTFKLEGWDDEKAKEFNSAIFSALCKTSESFLSDPSFLGDYDGLIEAEASMKAYLIPQLVLQANANDPIPDISRILKEKWPPSYAENSHVFFYAGLAGTLLVASTIAFNALK